MAEYSLDPNGTVISSNLILEPTTATAHQILDKLSRQPAVPDITSYIQLDNSVVPNSIVLDLESFGKVTAITVNSVTAWIYAEEPQAPGDLTVEIRSGGVAKATTSYSAATPTSAAWLDTTWPIPSDMLQSEISSLQLSITKTLIGPTTVNIYQAYIAVDVTISGMTFIAVSNNFTSSAVKPWRPRIKPGAFWI